MKMRKKRPQLLLLLLVVAPKCSAFLTLFQINIITVKCLARLTSTAVLELCHFNQKGFKDIC